MPWDEDTCLEVDCDQECCCSIPLPAELVLRFKNKIATEPVKYKPLNTSAFDEPHVIPVTKNLQCIFLEENGRCTIYRHRPEVCREYGKNELVRCGYIDLDGNPRSPEERERVIRENEDTTKKVLNMARVRSTRNGWF